MWCVGPKALPKSTEEGMTFRRVVEAVLVKCSLKDRIFFVGAAQRIWLRRNEVVHRGVFVHPNTLVQKT